MEALQIGLGVLVLMLLLAGIMSFVSAWQEAESAISSVISTGALRPTHAVIAAALCNGVGPLLHAPQIALLIAVGVVHPATTDSSTVFAALGTALAFTALAARTGWSLNTMHGALGGLIGASLAAQGLGGLSVQGAAVPLVAAALAPLAGFVCAGLAWVILAHLLRRSAPRSTDRFFRNAQWLSFGALNLGRGHQHAQSALGLIGLSLILAGLLNADHPTLPAAFTWIIALLVGAGTLAGGFARLRQRRLRLSRIRPAHACCAESASALVLIMASQWGVPVANSHLSTAATIGASQSGPSTLRRWGIDAAVWVSALMSLPAAALTGAVLERLFRWLIP
ncbi:MAG: hypothetical protein RL322_1841 [Pseudomonadota bacterium]|jgi:PiT family inorganic phosphate transporter